MSIIIYIVTETQVLQDQAGINFYIFRVESKPKTFQLKSYVESTIKVCSEKDVSHYLF